MEHKAQISASGNGGSSLLNSIGAHGILIGMTSVRNLTHAKEAAALMAKILTLELSTSADSDFTYSYEHRQYNLSNCK